MGRRDCSLCLFGDICLESKPCEDFCPALNCDVEESLNEKMENDYFEFCEEWFIYTNDDID